MYVCVFTIYSFFQYNIDYSDSDDENTMAILIFAPLMLLYVDVFLKMWLRQESALQVAIRVIRAIRGLSEGYQRAIRLLGY